MTAPHKGIEHPNHKQHGRSHKKDKKEADLNQNNLKHSGVLTFSESEFRKAAITNMEYGLIFFLDAVSISTYEGMANLGFHLNKSKLQSQKLFLDYHGREISKLRINGVDSKNIKKLWRDNKLELPLELLKEGQNEVEVYFKNEYADTSLEGGLFLARDSQEKYMYTVSQPFSSHKIFPCFDQSSIRATFKALLVTPEDWKVVSNDNVANIDDIGSGFTSDITFDLKQTLERLSTNWKLWAFDISERISPNVFGFVAGDLESITIKEKNHTSLKLSIYARKSVARQLRQESEDLLLLMAAAIENFEGFFGKDYPFRKCDLIFLPNRSEQGLDLAGCCIVNEELLLSYESDLMTNISRAVAIIQQQSLAWFHHYLAINWWNDTWIDQGLSLFLGYLGLTKIYRSINSKLKRSKGFTEKNIWSHFTFMKEIKSLKRGSETMNPVYCIFEDSTQYEATNLEMYQWKAASAWKQLAFLIGDENFKRGIKKCILELGGNAINTKQFATTFEESFNIQKETPMGISVDSFITTNSFEINTFDFSRWMHDWIYTGGVSILETQWDKENIMFNNMLKIRQSTVSQNPDTIRNLRLKIAFFDNVGQIFKIKDVVISSQEYTNFILEDRQRIPHALLLDCEGNSLFHSKIETTSFEFFSQKLYTITDELSVSLVVERCAQMVSEGKLYPTEYIQMVAKFLQEKSESVSGLLLQQILLLAQYIIEEFVPMQQQSQLKRIMCTSCFKLLREDSSSVEYQIALNETWRFIAKEDSVRTFLPVFYKYIDSVDDNVIRLAPKNVFQTLKNCYLVDQNKNHYHNFAKYLQTSNLNKAVIENLINSFTLTCEHDVEKELRLLEESTAYSLSLYSYDELKLTLASPLAANYIEKLSLIIKKKAEKLDTKNFLQFLSTMWSLSSDISFQQTLLNYLSSLDANTNEEALRKWTQLRVSETQTKKSAPWF